MRQPKYVYIFLAVLVIVSIVLIITPQLKKRKSSKKSTFTQDITSETPASLARRRALFFNSLSPTTSSCTTSYCNSSTFVGGVDNSICGGMSSTCPTTGAFQQYYLDAFNSSPVFLYTPPGVSSSEGQQLFATDPSYCKNGVQSELNVSSGFAGSTKGKPVKLYLCSGSLLTNLNQNTVPCTECTSSTGFAPPMKICFASSSDGVNYSTGCLASESCQVIGNGVGVCAPLIGTGKFTSFEGWPFYDGYYSNDVWGTQQVYSSTGSTLSFPSSTVSSNLFDASNQDFNATLVNGYTYGSFNAPGDPILPKCPSLLPLPTIGWSAFSTSGNLYWNTGCMPDVNPAGS